MSEDGSLFGLLALFVVFVLAVGFTVIGLSVISASPDIHGNCCSFTCCNNQNFQTKEITVVSKYTMDEDNLFKLTSFYIVTDKCETYKVVSPDSNERTVRPSRRLWDNFCYGGVYNVTINCNGEIICKDLIYKNFDDYESYNARGSCGCSQC